MSRSPSSSTRTTLSEESFPVLAQNDSPRAVRCHPLEAELDLEPAVVAIHAEVVGAAVAGPEPFDIGLGWLGDEHCAPHGEGEGAERG